MVIPIIFLVCCTFLLVFPLYKAPYDTGMALICVLSGIPVYLIGVSWKKKPKSFNRLVSKSHVCVYLSWHCCVCMYIHMSCT